jgi:IS30 family transposase
VRLHGDFSAKRALVRRLINERKSVRKIAITISVHNATIDRLWTTAA